MLRRSRAPLLLLAPAVVIAITALLLAPIPQPLTYHNFADHRSWLGISNFGDVASNLPFAIFGFWGLLVLVTPDKRSSSILGSAGFILRCSPRSS